MLYRITTNHKSQSHIQVRHACHLSEVACIQNADWIKVIKETRMLLPLIFEYMEKSQGKKNLRNSCDC
jgi:hypothetical protein